MDPERASGPSSSHHSYLHSTKHSASPPVTPSSSTFSQHHSSTSPDSTHHNRARSHSLSFHNNNNNNTAGVNNSKNSNHHGSIPISSVSTSPMSGSSGSTVGSSSSAGSRSMPSLKINMHQHSHHLDQFSRSISARTRRFFRQKFSRTTTRNNNISTTPSSRIRQFTTLRRVRLGVLIPLAGLEL